MSVCAVILSEDIASQILLHLQLSDAVNYLLVSTYVLSTPLIDPVP